MLGVTAQVANTKTRALVDREDSIQDFGRESGMSPWDNVDSAIGRNSEGHLRNLVAQL
jgi:hypothetical protein